MKFSFSNLFSSKKQETITNNKISFICDSNQESNIKIELIDLTQKDAEAFAIMLCDLLTGSYHTAIIDTLIDISSTDDHVKKFVNQVMSYYAVYLAYKSTNNTDETPLIKPSQFQQKWDVVK